MIDPIAWYVNTIYNFLERQEHGQIYLLALIVGMAAAYIAFPLVVLFCILSVAIVTAHERKILAQMQSRRGPSRVGYLGILQPIGDALKLMLKEYVVPRVSLTLIMSTTAGIAFLASAWVLSAIPFNFEFVIYSDDLTFFFMFIFSMYHVYSVLFAGWSSKSRYSTLGALRTAAQLISYEILMSVVCLNLFANTKLFSFKGIYDFQIDHTALLLALPVQAIVFFIGGLAETNRHPFDLPEAEAELVAGYNVEYSSIRFAMFFLSEYLSVIIFAIGLNSLFLECNIFNLGIAAIFSWPIKISAVIFLVIYIRGLVPRYRYDQLMNVCWKFLIPIEFSTVYYTVICDSLLK